MSRFEFEVYRAGAVVRKLNIDLQSTPTISWTADAEIKRTLSMSCPVVEGIDWVTDEIQAIQHTEDGKRLPLGRFVITTFPRKVNALGISTWDLTGYDYGYKVRNLAKLEDSLTISAGTNVTQAITAQLMASGVDRVMLTRSSETLTTDHVWEAGTTRYRVISELLNEINYRDLWFDGSGNAVIEPWVPADAERSKHHYYAGSSSLIMPELVIEDDIFDAANVFIELVSSADAYTTDASGAVVPLRAESVNNNPDSRVSVMRRGMRVPSIEVLDTITSAAALQTRANNRKLQSMMGSRIYTFYTGVHLENVQHGLNDAMFVDRDGIGLLEEQNWSISCAPGGLMTHTARKAYYV